MNKLLLISLALILSFNSISQLKSGDIGTAVADSALISKLKNKFKYGVTVYIFIDRHGSGRKYPPLTADEVINLIPNNKGYINYSNGEYIFVIDDQNPQRGKKETIWDVYIINKNKTFPNISDQVFAENKSGQFYQSFIITFKQFKELKEIKEIPVSNFTHLKVKTDHEVSVGPQIVLNVNKTLNINPEGFDYFLAFAPEPTVSDFNALKKDPDSEIQRLDVEIENQENKITEFKKVSDQLLLKPYTELMNSLTVLNNKIKVLNDIDSTKRSIRWNIDNYKASQKDLENYNILKSIKLFTNVTTDKKANKFIEKLRKFYGLSNRLLFSENQIYEYIAGLRIETLELVELNEKDLKKYKKLQANQSFKILEDQKKVIKKLTGLDSNYFELIDEVSKVDEEYSSNLEEFLEMKSNYDYLIEAYKNLYDSKIDELQLLEDKKDELRQLRKTYSGKKQFLESKKKYPTIKCNEISISPVFLAETHFRNGDALREARTESEWIKFCTDEIPCYKIENYGTDDLTKNNILYNIWAIADERIIAPHGFHMMNYHDFYKSYGTIPAEKVYPWSRASYEPLYKLDYSKTKREKCEKQQRIYKKCDKCANWTKSQKKTNVCSKCNNKEGWYTDKYETCVWCEGRGYIDKKEYLGEFLSHVIPDDFISGWKDGDFRGDYMVIKWRDGEYENHKFRRGEYWDYRFLFSDEFYTESYRISLVENKNYSNLTCENEKLSKGGIEFMDHLLDVTTFQNGDPIKLIEDPVEWQIALRDGIPAYCYYDNNPENSGCIYNMHCWNDKRGLIPSGWRSFKYSDRYALNLGEVRSDEINRDNDYDRLQKNSVPYINFEEFPYLRPKGTRNSDGSFSERHRTNKRLEQNHLNFIYKPFAFDRDWYEKRYSGYLIPYFRGMPYYYGDSYRDPATFTDKYGEFNFPVTSGCVILCRDVKE